MRPRHAGPVAGHSTLQSSLLPPHTGHGALRVATYNIHKGVRGLGPRKRLEIHNLGLAVEAFDESGRAIRGEPGELVCTKPFPSMPLYFIDDAHDARYRETYFERFPGVWCHGDVLKLDARGGCYIYGRADSTLNRRGIRIGTAEVYRVVESIEGVVDSLAVCVAESGISEVMLLFVVLAPGRSLDAALTATIRDALRTRYSPRHVPDRIVQVPGIPYTLTGKKMEIPVRKILSGVPVERVASRDAIRQPEALDFFAIHRASLTALADPAQEPAS